jgi:hypothetical protein
MRKKRRNRKRKRKRKSETREKMIERNEKKQKRI